MCIYIYIYREREREGEREREIIFQNGFLKIKKTKIKTFQNPKFPKIATVTTTIRTGGLFPPFFKGVETITITKHILMHKKYKHM